MSEKLTGLLYITKQRSSQQQSFEHEKRKDIGFFHFKEQIQKILPEKLSLMM